MNEQKNDLGSTLLVVAVGSMALIVGIGICLVWRWLPYVGYIALGTVIVVLVCLAVNAIIYTLRQLTQETYYDIAEYGTCVKGLFSNPILLAPIAQTTATNAAKIAKADVQVAIPTLFDLLAVGEIHYGMQDMILGYQEGGQVVRGPWPRTFAVAGKGRSGKTRRVVFMIIQALMGGAHITVCDPHYTKRDSLTKELEPLSPWLSFAGTDTEIEAATDTFLDEMERRVHGESSEAVADGVYKPRLVVYDEWSRLMLKMTEEQQEKLKGTVTGASQEYAAYDGFVCIIGQNWTNDVCGGTAIRRALHAVFVHRIDTDYAKYLIKPAKWHKQSEQLATGHCIYQDLDGKISKLVMPFVEDRAGAKIAELLMQVAPPVQQERIEGPVSDTSSHEQFELKYLASPREIPTEAANTYNASFIASNALPQAKVSDEHYIAVLREIGKKLKNGASPNDIRKGLGIDGGRALQEVNAALAFLQKEQVFQEEDQKTANDTQS